jgi:predicted CoA-binding protein
MADKLSDKSAWANPKPREIQRIIKKAKTIAVVGLSSKIDRPSNRVAAYLQRRGYDVIPVNPGETEILGCPSYPNLAAIGRAVDIVDVFRRPEDGVAIAAEAIRIGAGCIWLQEGIVSEEAYRLAGAAGVPIVMDRCLKKEHQRLKT